MAYRFHPHLYFYLPFLDFHNFSISVYSFLLFVCYLSAFSLMLIELICNGLDLHLRCDR